MGLRLPMLELVQRFYDRTRQEGLEACGTQVLAAVVAADQGFQEALRALEGLKSAGQ